MATPESGFRFTTPDRGRAASSYGRVSYTASGGDKAIIMKALSERAGQAVEQLQSWYLTSGDTDWFHALPAKAIPDE